MKDENSNTLKNLINNIKLQEPIIPIEGVSEMSKGFFTSPKAWFQSWMKPVGIAAVGAIVLLVSFLAYNKANREELAKDINTNHSKDVNINQPSDSIAVVESFISPEILTEQEPEKSFNIWSNKKQDDEFDQAYHPQKYVLTKADSAVLYSLSAEVQTFQIDALRDTFVMGKLGTKLVFYKACFEDSLGNVIKSNVNINLKECYNYPDMVKENLNTHCDSGYLESKGMVWVDAKSESKKLRLRKGFDMPIEFASKKTEDFDLYYADADKFTETNWELDSMGKVPNPVIFASTGRYWDKMFNYFNDNYKMDKLTMLSLYQKTWGLHFTSSNAKMIGYTSCNYSYKEQDLNEACYKFRDLCENLYDKVPRIKRSSWVTQFQFSCISRDSLNRWLDNDTIQRMVDKAVFDFVMNSPFYAARLGWINCDHPLNLGFLNRQSQVVTLENYPNDGFTKTYLLLKSTKAIANPGLTAEGAKFMNMPRNEDAILFSYRLINGKITYVQMDINTSSDSIVLANYEPIDADGLIGKIENLISSQL